MNNTKTRTSSAEATTSNDWNVSDNACPENLRYQTKRNLATDVMISRKKRGPVNSFENIAMNQHNVSEPAMTIPTPLDIVQSSNSNMNPYPYMGMSFQNMHGVVGQENTFFPLFKESVQLTTCVLHPPNQNALRPTTRERPLGCKTVFVGGLPEKITEEIIEEIFEGIETIRMSKKNFCLIRFSEEMYAENATYFSGYKLKIENKDEAPFTGILHVDYAQVQDDWQDYECKKQALQRQARHQEQDYYRHYTDHEAVLMCEKLENEETFTLAADIVIGWLEKNECTNENADRFYSMLKSIHKMLFKLHFNKMNYEDNLKKAKKIVKDFSEDATYKLAHFEKIFQMKFLEKYWNHFSENQRKNIKVLEKELKEIKKYVQMETAVNEHEVEDVDFSIDESVEPIIDVNQLETDYDEGYSASLNHSDKNKFQEASDAVMESLKRGYTTKEDASYFFSVIQYLLNRSKNILNDIIFNKKSLKKAKKEFTKNICNISHHCVKIDKVCMTVFQNEIIHKFDKFEKTNIQMLAKQNKILKDAIFDLVIIC